MIEGERVVTAMAFTILRMHRKKLLKMRDMDEITDFLQCQLHRDFGYSDDFVIKVLEQSMTDLRRFKMDLPPPPQECELPKYECGRFIEPDYESKVSSFENYHGFGYPVFRFIKVRTFSFLFYSCDCLSNIIPADVPILESFFYYCYYYYYLDNNTINNMIQN